MKFAGPLRAALCAALALMPVHAPAQNPFHGKAWPKTDFTAFLVDPLEFEPGGPNKDGIPAIDFPRMHPAAEEHSLDPREPVISVKIEGQLTRGYPLRYLLWHEVVNDTVGHTDIAVTYSVLVDSAVVYDRRDAEGNAMVFGVSGLLRFSNSVLFDRGTESWWQQTTGRAIVGSHAGERLTPLPARVESWDVFRLHHPDGLVMMRPEWERAYGTTPFVGYDNAGVPARYAGPLPPKGIAPLERVLRVGSHAWRLSRLMSEGRITEAGLVLTWTPGMASTHDAADIARARDIGMVRVRDAVGRDLPHDVIFAFCFAAFWPDGRWMLEGCGAAGLPC
ncbi:DUF3179 domain-containing protein [Pseudooceanicola nanhaiensis]|uniref:DUF3179 domain-containing protein n=1 Tax=Pseudooceanicola nanhaiensis TaxID=375761 RepID=UPI004058D282